MKKVKILISDDHNILQQGLRNSFETEKGFEVVAIADSGRIAIELASLHQPDIIIMDVSMPELNGMEATKQILAKNPDIKIMALSMHMEKIYVNGMMNAGASGYMLKSCSFKELLTGIRTILSGDQFFCPEIRHLISRKDGRTASDRRGIAFQLLSNREREVLQLISEGHKTKIIAEKLNISAKTVDVHRKNLKIKLDIHSVAELTKFAILEGLTTSIL